MDAGASPVNIGDNATGKGTVAVDGANSLLTNSIGMTVGNAGTGTRTVSNGDSVSTSGVLNIAKISASTGTLNVGAAQSAAAVPAPSPRAA
ncbi:hypothetical protein [Phyllobacterium phragmitis]|uniref:hypothetical protein n=1 Tax=Phyllobacterium phragmitis TaxID=2670329 RepID=UPI0038B2A528